MILPIKPPPGFDVLVSSSFLAAPSASLLCILFFVFSSLSYAIKIRFFPIKGARPIEGKEFEFRKQQ
jgi:hypothetical protein